jgi:hypothetical protein
VLADLGVGWGAGVSFRPEGTGLRARMVLRMVGNLLHGPAKSGLDQLQSDLMQVSPELVNMRSTSGEHPVNILSASGQHLVSCLLHSRSPTRPGLAAAGALPCLTDRGWPCVCSLRNIWSTMRAPGCRQKGLNGAPTVGDLQCASAVHYGHAYKPLSATLCQEEGAALWWYTTSGECAIQED